MKLEALQSLSIAALIVGLLLSAIGAYGTFRFSGEKAREQRQEASTDVDPEDAIVGVLPVHGGSEKEKLSAIIDPIIIDPVPEPAAAAPAVLNGLLPHLPPVGEGPVETVAEPVKTPVLPKPDPVKVEPAKIGPPKPEPAPSPVVTAAPPAEVKIETPDHSRFPGLGLAPWQVEKLLQRLKSHSGGAIGMQVPEGNDEARQFAHALQQVFAASGWHVTGVEVVKSPRGGAGLTLSSGTFPPPVEVTTVFSAFVTAGIKLGTDLDPAQGKHKAVLHIGSRP